MVFGVLLHVGLCMSPTEDSAERKRRESRKNERPRSLLDWLNRPRPEFKDESEAPPVDRALLTRLVKNELSEAEASAAYRLVYSFESWDAAHTEILTEHFREANTEDDANAE